jgi:hypothetical protein
VGKTWLGGFGWVITYNNLVKRSSKDQKKENGTGLMIACELLGGDRKLFLVVATYSTLLHPLLPSHVCIYIYRERETDICLGLSVAICCWLGNQEKVWQNFGECIHNPNFFPFM